jgi:hypothetical protein
MQLIKNLPVFQPDIRTSPESLFQSVEGDDDEDNDVADALGVVLVDGEVDAARECDLVLNQTASVLLLANLFDLLRFFVDLKFVSPFVDWHCYDVIYDVCL